MSLEKWASLAEIVSGIAVVVTLIFLVVGIRENSNIMRASSFTSATDSLIELNRDIMTDGELAEIFEAWVSNDTSQLDPQQRARLNQMAVALFRIYEKAFLAEQYDLLGPGEWRRFERTICLIYPDLQSAGLQAPVRVALTDEFVQFIDAKCSASN
jgi:uncharacterized membrane protein YeiB